MRLLFADPVARGEVDDQVPCLHVTWLGFAPSAAYRRVLNRSLRVWGEEQARRPADQQLLGALSDTRLFTALTSADQEWAVADWNPRALAAGLQRIAFLIPTNVFGRMSVTDTLRKSDAAGQTLETALFDSVEAARAWLRNGN